MSASTDDGKVWLVLVGKSDEAWDELVPLDTASEWVEAWDDVVPGYRQQRYADEEQANCAVASLRANGLPAATEPHAI